jgi:hypothetical protein
MGKTVAHAKRKSAELKCLVHAGVMLNVFDECCNTIFPTKRQKHPPVPESPILVPINNNIGHAVHAVFGHQVLEVHQHPGLRGVVAVFGEDDVVGQINGGVNGVTIFVQKKDEVAIHAGFGDFVIV